MKDKNFERINIKTVISMQQSTSIPIFREFDELQILGSNLPKKL